MAPTGPVTTPAPWGSFGVDWENVTRYDSFIREAADAAGWPIERVRAHIMIESQGTADAIRENPNGGGAYGLMQIVPYGVGWDGWHALVKEKAGLPADAPEKRVRQALLDPRINIHVGVAILEMFFATHGTLDAASGAYITGSPTWESNIISEFPMGRTYRKSMHGLIAEQSGDMAPVASRG
jgi:soluble lytic murein transglycosylase-like protein